MNMDKNFKNLRYKSGNFALYAAVFLLFGILISVFLFFPEFINMQSGIYGISCKDIRRKLDSAVSDYNANNSVAMGKPGARVDADTLKEKGYLDEIKKCPMHGIYLFDKNGKVICTYHTKDYKLK